MHMRASVWFRIHWSNLNISSKSMTFFDLLTVHVCFGPVMLRIERFYCFHKRRTSDGLLFDVVVVNLIHILKDISHKKQSYQMCNIWRYAQQDK